jgi:ribosomal protein S18 acetylase RimI-like enzyme
VAVADGRAKKSNGELTIRLYQVADRERIRILTTVGFAGVIVDYVIDERWPGANDVPWSERKFLDVSDDLANHPKSCFVAELNGEVVGFITTVISEVKSQGHVRDLVVDAALRGRGVGRQLLTHALNEFRCRGLKIARIETLAHNEVGAHLFPAVGFQQVAIQYHYAMLLFEDGFK